VIVVAGLSPAWQQIMRFDGLRLGEVNRARDVARCASGKVVNVAVALAHLRVACDVVALVGGEPGREIDRELATLAIGRSCIQSAAPTRVCTTIIDSQSGRVTELVENAGSVTPDELAEFQTAYAEQAAKARAVVLTGSLPPGAPRTFYFDLLASTKCPAILDGRGPELIASLERRPFLVKPNREELAFTLGRDLKTDAELHSAMRELNDRGASWVVVTAGARPAWASSHGELFRFDVPQMAAVNPIGSGDCLAAGIAWGLAEGKEPCDAIRLGIAAAVENVGQLLPGRLDPQQVRARWATIRAQRVF
jgi:1-phosphofructokinase family hexose kinase